MTYLNNNIFWVSVCLAYLLVNLKTPFSRTFQFGIINFVCMILLFTFKVSIVCLGGATLIWILLFGIAYFNKNTKHKTAKIFPWLCVTAVTIIFLLHKSSRDNNEMLGAGKLLFEKYSVIQPIFFLMTLITFSYIFLRILDAIRTVMAGHAILDPISLLGYLAPFHIIAAGPINIYKEHLALNKNMPKKPTFDNALKSINIITTGLFFKFVCAEGLRILFFGLEGKLTTGNFLQSGFIVIYIFFDFAGYSYVTYGIGQLLDIPTPLNFNHPYLSKTITEFWNRWHISLGDFIKKTIFTPLQVSMARKFGIVNTYWVNFISLVVSFVFVGIWHCFSINFILWGVVTGSIVACEKIVRDSYYKKQLFKIKVINKLLSFSFILGPCYVFFVIVSSLHFAMPDLIP